MTINEAIVSFNSGELSPKIDVRIDTEKYKAGCRRLENMIPTKYGGVERRPGTSYIGSSYNDSPVVRLLPFKYSSAIVYTIEMGPYYFRFYYGNTILKDDGNEVIVETPYDAEDLFQIQYYQLGDIMWLVHPNYAPRKLKRTGPYTFVLEEIEFRKGPFLTRNDLLDIDNPNPPTLACTITQAGQYGTMKASGALFTQDHVGAIYKLSHARTIKSATLSGSGQTPAIKGKGTYNLITRGTWTGTIIWQRKEGESAWEEFRSWTGSTDAHQNVNFSYKEESDSTSHRIYSADASAKFRGDFSIDEPLKSGIVKIVGVGGSNSAIVYVLSDLESTSPTVKWYEGAWSRARGYPSSITFFEDRCVYAGASAGSAGDVSADPMYPELISLL